MNDFEGLKKDIKALNELHIKDRKNAINEGILIGMKHIGDALFDFIDAKVNKGFPAYIGKNELVTFMKTYVDITKKEFDKEKETSNISKKPIRKLIYKEDHQMYYYIPIVFETNCNFDVSNFEEVSRVAGVADAR